MVGIVLRRLGLLDEAAWNSKKALELDKNLVAAKMNIANVEFQKGDFKKAIKLLRIIVGEQPSYQEAKANLALAYKNIGYIEESINIYKDLEYRGSWAVAARFNYGTTKVTIGCLKDGWRDYEYRWKVSPGNKIIWPFEGKPLWKGEREKHVVLWREQGIGDDIIFLSLVSEVRAMCSSLSVYVEPRLRSLCRRAMPEINFITDKNSLEKEQCDYHLPLGSVPGLIRNDIRDFDRTVKGYFKADPDRVESLRNELQLGGKTVIGISWQSFKSLSQINKSVQLRDMGRIFLGLDIVLINLQYGDVDDEIREFKEETGIEVLQCSSVDNREDLDGLAALIEACDIVVSTSNVTVHMAGALAKETWVLLPYVVVNFWWLTKRPKSIWYPSLTLYRQPALDDWDSVYQSVRKDLISKIL